MSEQRLTIKDIALAAGVSPQTVSRVINDSPDVSTKTRQKVQALIHDHGYHPNAIARSLIKRQTHTIGVMVSDLEYTGPHLVLSGIEQEASALGYSLNLTILHEPGKSDVEVPLRSLLSQQVDGIIWLVPEHGQNYSWWRQNPAVLSRLPVIFMDARPSPGITVVGCDNRYGARLITSHLLDCGYRNIAIITGMLDGWEAQERQAGWREALQARGINPEKHQMDCGNWSAESGFLAMQRILTHFPQVDAVFACADYMALGAIHAAIAAGRRVPQDLAVAGFDGWTESAHYNPPLTTIQKPFMEAGRMALRELHRRIESRRSNKTVEDASILLQPKLVLRASTVQKQAA